MLSETEFTAFEENLCQTLFLLFSYLDFRVSFAWYPPESFKKNLSDLHLVEIRQYKLSFYAKAAQLLLISHRHFSEVCMKLRTAPWAGTRPIIGLSY